MKKVFVVLALWCIAVLLLSGCSTQTLPMEESTPAEDSAPRLLLAGEGAPAYVVVRSDTAAKAEAEAAVRVRKKLEACGVKTKVTTDWEENPVSEYEIVVGDTLRAASDAGMTLTPHDVGENGYFIKVSASRIYVCGGTPAATMLAVDYFLAEFFGGESAVSVPADYEYIVRQSYALSAITVGGRSLSEFRIVCGESAAEKSAAERVQKYFYTLAGIHMEIDSKNAGNGPALIVSGSATRGEGTMTVRCADGNLLLHTEPLDAFERGFSRFTDAYFKGVSGEVKLEDGFLFTADLMNTVSYLEFGAKGDGIADDMPAIIAAHAFANRYSIPVRADAGKTFRIGPSQTPAVIKTDTDFTDVVFRIDDREVPDAQRGIAVFHVEPSSASVSLPALKSVRKGQTDLGMTLAADSLVILTDASTKRWIRKGVNANDGSEQQEVILVSKDGQVDPSTPIQWDYARVTYASAIPLEEKTLTVKGGTFITVARRDIPNFSYYTRGIRVTRSNVLLDGLTYQVENEGKSGAPYYGFLNIADCADVTVRDFTFAIHRRFEYQQGKQSLSAGTYSITLTRTTGVKLERCIQTTDILDKDYSAALGSNHARNLTVDGCRFTNCDIGHTGAYNTVIRNSTIGATPVSAIGGGTLLIENSSFYAHAIVNLRNDYGAHWDGEIIIRDCTWTPNLGNSLTKETYSVVTGENTEDHDFGYACTMPHAVTIENLRVEDGKTTPAYRSVSIFADITPRRTNAAAEAAAKYPLRVTETLHISNVSTASGKAWFLSPNSFAFRDTAVIMPSE